MDIVAVLADRQSGLVGGQILSVSRLSFPIKPFHPNLQSTLRPAKKSPFQQVSIFTKMDRVTAGAGQTSQALQFHALEIS